MADPSTRPDDAKFPSCRAALASPLTFIAQLALFAPAQQAARLTDAISDYMYGEQSPRAQRIAVGV